MTEELCSFTPVSGCVLSCQRVIYDPRVAVFRAPGISGRAQAGLSGGSQGCCRVGEHAYFLRRQGRSSSSARERKAYQQRRSNSRGQARGSEAGAQRIAWLWVSGGRGTTAKHARAVCLSTKTRTYDIPLGCLPDERGLLPICLLAARTGRWGPKAVHTCG